MKAVLTFKLPKEKYEYHQAVNAWRYAKCLKEIKNYFDAHVDGGGKNKSLTAGLVQEMIQAIMENENILIDEL